MSVLKVKDRETGEWVVAGSAYGYREECLQAGDNVHAQYFTIADDGLLALKPEYRGACPSFRNTYTYGISDKGIGAAGSKNAELPSELFIPSVVDEIAVVRLADGMFLYNEAVETVVIPNCIAEIPERFCDDAIHLKKVYNTEHIHTIGKCAFQFTHIDRGEYPNLENMGISVFNGCGFLVYADIGKVQEVPDSSFTGCMMLSRIKGGTDVATVGADAFFLCVRLNNVEFLPNLKSIGNNAFLRCRLNYDWASLQDCSFGNWATALQLNPTDIWSGCQVTAAENPVPTLLSQLDPRWTERQIGTSGYKYSNGCVLFTAMHIYCALHGLSLSTIEEFEQIVKNIDPDILNTFEASLPHMKTLCEQLGMKVEYYAEYTQASLQAVYDGLAAGKYAVAMFAPKYGSSTGHAAMIHGVKANGELLIADSAFTPTKTLGEGEKTLRYAIPYQNGINPSLDVYIVSQ